MPRSLGLTLYTLLGPREDAPPAQRPGRPAGRLVWLHAPDAPSLAAMTELARRVTDEDGHPVLLTAPPPAAPPPAALPPGAVLQPPPPDAPGAAADFLDHWRPDACVLAGGELRPAVLAEAFRRGLPVALVNATVPRLPADRARWWPGLMPGLLGRMHRVLAVDEGAARAVRRAGCPQAAIEIAGRMEEGRAVLPCAESDRLALAHRFGTRPVWLAAGLPEAEEETAVAAHRAALRLAHRLLMIVVPQDGARVDPLALRLGAEGWTVARRGRGEEPDPETEVYIADGEADYGLFYRLAPIAYMGGSLSAAGAARDPLEAAALGSAILHGPRHGAFGATFDRLGQARAARAVAGGADLCDALGDLLSPDRAARLAQAAWDVASEGAEATDRAVRLVRRMLGED